MLSLSGKEQMKDWQKIFVYIHDKQISGHLFEFPDQNLKPQNLIIIVVQHSRENVREQICSG